MKERSASWARWATVRLRLRDFFGRSASDVKQAMERAGLHCVSAHYSYADLAPHLDETIEYGKALGLEYIICASPGFPHGSPAKDRRIAKTAREAMTLDDWRWNAEQFNRMGERVNAAGMQIWVPQPYGGVPRGSTAW